MLGLAVEIQSRRRIFVPIGRVTTIDPEAVVLTTGTVSLRRFDKRPGETLVLTEMLDRRVTVLETGEEATVVDIAMERQRTEWLLSRVAVRRGGRRRRAELLQLAWDEISGFSLPEADQGAANLLAVFEKLRPADLAGVLHDLSGKRRAEIAAALDDERLADVLEELPEDEQVELLGGLEDERAADVLEAMAPDDAADLLGRARAGRGAAPARAHGARRGRSGAPAAGLQRRHRRRPHDQRAGHRRPGHHGRGGARAGAQPRPVAGPGRAGLRRAAAVRDADRALPRHRALPAPAARAAEHADQLGHRTTSTRWRPTARSPRSPGTSRRTTSSRCRSSTPSSACSARSPSTTCSTTCCRRTGATPAGPTVADRTAERRAARRARLDQPAEPRSRRPHYDPDAFGRLSERIARFLGTAKFLVYMTVFIALWVVVNVTPIAFDPYTFTFLTLLLSLQASYAAPLILLAQNRQTDRDRIRWRRTAPRTRGSWPRWSTSPASWRRCGRRSARSRPATSCASSCGR